MQHMQFTFINRLLIVSMSMILIWRTAAGYTPHRYTDWIPQSASALATHSKYYYQSHVEKEVSIGSGSGRAARPTPEAYDSLRSIFFRLEESKALGSDIELTERELQANQIIMEVKLKEYDEGLMTPYLFNPSQHIFSVLDRIRQSPLFNYIRSMPKGGVLHAHDTALCSTDFIIKLTYRPNLWVCQVGANLQLAQMRFSRQMPSIMNETNDECHWVLLSSLRNSFGAKLVDEYLRGRFTLYPKQKFTDINYAWQAFGSIFMLIDGLLMYAPVWSDYYYNALEEFAADGVQYLEFRTTLPVLYDLDGTDYKPLDTVRIYSETLARFMKAHPNFIGSKLIYAPLRAVDNDKFDEYVRICIEIKKNYPDFFAGFDLVGQEEMGRPLKDFVPQLLQMPDDIDFYFHAGETNFYGSSVDENVIDAILLGTKRIGHGFALIKHPLVLQMLKERNVAVEINPVSNQVLQLISDYRNHPSSHLFADNYPVVISSDDPSFWKATPLSHDFYMAFLGIASAHSDIRLLKKLALNSIQYSALSAAQKAEARSKWQQQWDHFIEQVVTGESNASSNRLQTNRLD